MNIIVKLKNKNNELKYKNASFYINIDFSKNTEEVIVNLLDEKNTLLLIANRESVEYIYLYNEK